MMWKPFAAPVLAAVALGVAVPFAVASAPAVADLGDTAFLTESADLGDVADDTDAAEDGAEVALADDDADLLDAETEAALDEDMTDADVEEGVVEAGEKKEDKAKEKRERPTFPMAAAAFKRHIESRLAHSRERLQNMMRKHEVSATDQAEMLKIYDASAAQVRVKVESATADGKVTREEAAEVRALVKELREDIKRKIAAEKAESAQDRVKAKNNGKPKGERKPKRPSRI